MGINILNGTGKLHGNGCFIGRLIFSMRGKEKKRAAAVWWMPFWWGNKFNKRLAAKRVRQSARKGFTAE